MIIPILSDLPSQTDALDFSVYAELLANIIQKAEQLPLTVGIFGDWGSGKTTLMQMIQGKLQGGTKTLWFNAWRYDNKEYLSKAFLKTIHDQIWASNEVNRELFKDVAERVGNLAGKISGNKPLGSIFFDTFSLDPAYQNMLEETTRTLINRYAGKNGCLVIFVDDLDRCLPENAITILETFKLYLDQANCIIVLGVDKQIIETAIRLRYPDLKISGKDYLEKMVQIPFSIPLPNRLLMSQYLDACSLFNDKKLADFGILKDILLSGSGLNMRRLKRLVNQLNLTMSLGGGEPVQETQWAVLVKLLVLQTRFADFFAEVKRHPDAIYRFHQLLNARTDDARNTALQTLPHLEDFLENPFLCSFFRDTQNLTCTNTQQVQEMLQLAIVAK
ncbi:MAG: hypothetical protein GY862_04110 [Gammaproteobacteria bacterium]|nr:hypothetical protein [Gammaproteobacteria bacterium]